MLKHKNIESYLPVFIGFYETVFSPDEDYVIESPYNYDNYEFDYSGYRKRVCKAATNQIEAVLKELGFDIEITYQSLYTPKEYNFTTDSINVKYKLNDSSIKKINEYLLENSNKFEAYIKYHFTTKDGFISFYSNNADVWFKQYLNDKEKLNVCFGQILEFIFENEEYTYNELYNDICSDCYLDGWLKESTIETIEYINQYTTDNYKNKDIDSIIENIQKHFENLFDYEYLAYSYIKDIVNEVFNNIESNNYKLKF